MSILTITFLKKTYSPVMHPNKSGSPLMHPNKSNSPENTSKQIQFTSEHQNKLSSTGTKNKSSYQAHQINQVCLAFTKTNRAYQAQFIFLISLK